MPVSVKNMVVNTFFYQHQEIAIITVDFLEGIVNNFLAVKIVKTVYSLTFDNE